jgi:hypothetical protein
LLRIKLREERQRRNGSEALFEFYRRHTFLQVTAESDLAQTPAPTLHCSFR